MNVNEFYNQFNSSDVELVKSYLQKRYVKKKSSKKFGIVYDILHQCDLNCIGCGTNAVYIGQTRLDDVQPSFQQIRYVLYKVKTYVDSINVPVFVNIGGGEPFLRKDILDILKSASELFGEDGVGVDTNGTLDCSYELINQAMKYSSYVGISVNGLEDYHNWWAGNKRINPFQRSMDTIKKLCDSGDYQREKLEVTSVATNRNLGDIPKLIEMLSDIGVKNYSIHRAMPVGRMSRRKELLPTAKEYFELLVSVIKAADKTGMDVHIHHSIESIHETLMLGLSTYEEDKVGNPDIGSSIGIEPEGRLVFDPWCTSGMWTLLSSGCIYDNNLKFEELLTDKGSVFDISKIYTAPHLRCNGCQMPCSGGSRIVSAANSLLDVTEKDVQLSDLLSAMIAMDPACPFYKEEEDDEEF